MAANPPVPTANSTCHFFQISGEVRNMIYSYLLHDPRGLRYIPTEEGQGKFHTYNENPNDTTARSYAANQIMYTCRQLRRETAGLELRYNDLHFVHYEDAISFFDNLNTREYRFLHSVYVAPHDSVSIINDLVEICHNYPHITIWVRSPNIRTGNAGIIFQLMLYEMQIRGTTDLAKRFLTRPYTCAKILDSVRLRIDKITRHRTRRYVISERPFPVNYRFLPFDTLFDEQKFRDCIEGNGIMRDAILPTVEGGLRLWMDIMEEVYQVGV